MIQPADFSPYGWERLKPFLARQPEGGVILIAVEVLPTQNWPRVSYGAFSAEERKKLKAALIGINRARKNRGEPSTRELPSPTSKTSDRGCPPCLAPSVTKKEGAAPAAPPPLN